MKEIDVLGVLAKYKIQTSILGVLLSISSFQIWKYQQEQREKFLAEKQINCEKQFQMAETYVHNSKALYNHYYLHRLVAAQELEKPGINAPLKIDEYYILMYLDAAQLLPEQPRYEGEFFRKFTGKWKNSPPPLMVRVKSKQGNKAIVTTHCSPKPFEVSLENLYETIQSVDFRIPEPAFSIF